MAKKFEFRLESVMKLRLMAEEKCRQELGLLIQELQKIDNQIASDNNAIDQYYSIQEKSLSNGAQSERLAFFPMMVKGKNTNLKLLADLRLKVVEEIENKKVELNQKRAEVKVMEKLKEKDHKKYKRELFLAQEKVREDNTQLWLHHQKKDNAV